MEPLDTRSRRCSGPRPSRAAVARCAVVAGLALGAFGLRAAFSQQPPPPSQGVPQIIITGGTQRFAIPDCIPRKGDQASRDACRTLTQVLRNDLRFEVDASQFVPDSLLAAIPPLNPEAPNFKDWQSIGAGVLVVSRAEVTGDELAVELRVHHVGSGQSMLSKRYAGRGDNPRAFAHQGSDDILTLTQIRGVARTKLAFVSDRDATRERRSKELYIVDYDGFNPRRVTVNGSLNILPAWTPDGRSIAYVSYRQGTPLIYLASIYEGRSTPNLTGERGSQALGVSFSPDGKRVAFASNRSGNMDVWVANADGSGARNLTQNPASDTAPCWSPTGQQLAFTSSRTGAPQVFLMDAETGLNVERLTRVGNYNDACAWNPARQWSEIAYTSRVEGNFEVAVVDLGSRQARQITLGRGSCEYPTWAPNGRHLAFSCNRSGTWQIGVSDRDGRTVQTLATGPGNNVQPDWGS